ncbi:hypothetical protein Fot_20677 [Forsythia ovata]|uniref:Uncharacterized protein n=1 Tax=Forsythia ovata TaxID=205694 RepID=A0ABD1USP8_9LAMI
MGREIYEVMELRWEVASDGQEYHLITKIDVWSSNPHVPGLQKYETTYFVVDTSPDFHASVALPPAAAFEDSAPGEGKACVIVVIMVEVWWSLLGAAVPAVIAGQAFRLKRKRAEEQRIKSARGREKSADDIFVCERVCTSKRMLKKVGAFSKDPIPDTCVTVCGVSELDACSDACARTVCVNQHQVPNWNDVCLRRCQSECLKLSASRSS